MIVKLQTSRRFVSRSTGHPKTPTMEIDCKSRPNSSLFVFSAIQTPGESVATKIIFRYLDKRQTLNNTKYKFVLAFIVQTVGKKQ